ncbi:hypothetical protein HQ560_02420 [bacterium]|nr:hypothetical protein [bacterium]
MQRYSVLLTVSFLLSFLTSHVFGDIQPSFDHATLAWHATDIVVAAEGKKVDGTLKVLEVWAGGRAVGDSVFVPHVWELLAEAKPGAPIAGGAEPPALSPQRVLLFLRRLPPKRGQAMPVWGPAAKDGGMKVSLAWLTGRGVYAYAQVWNPGPLVLTRYGRHTEATLREQVKGILTVRSRLGHSPNDMARAKEEIRRLKAELAYANDLLAKLKAVHPELWFEIAPGDGHRPTPMIRAKVTAVDPKLGLVVINAGQRQGVTKGMAFIVFRADKYIGKLIVDEVFPDVSACHYDRPSMHGDPEVGDDVTTKLEVEVPRPAPTIRAKATAVDHKLGLVVINAGQRQGVTKGMVFFVFRGEEYVGKIIVDEVFPDVSACRYERGFKGGVEGGDTIRNKFDADD